MYLLKYCQTLRGTNSATNISIKKKKESIEIKNSTITSEFTQAALTDDCVHAALIDASYTTYDLNVHDYQLQVHADVRAK